MEENKPPIGNMTAGFMLLVAGFFDLIQFGISLLGFLPTVVTQILAITVTTPLTFFAYMVFTIWFGLLNVQFFRIKKPKAFFARLAGLLGEALPYVSSLPILSTSVLMTIVEANGPDKFPGNMLPKFLLSFTPAGRVVQATQKVGKVTK